MRLLIAATLIGSALSAALAGYAAWTYQANRYEADLADMRLSASQAIRKTEQKYAEQFRKAEDAAKVRERTLRRDIDRAASAADRLRQSLDDAAVTASGSHASCLERADTLSDLLLEMERAGRGMAQACDRHINDIRTLTEAWPK